LKILQINKFASIRGGTETVLFNTIDLLKEKGHKVLLFSTDEYKAISQPIYTIPYFNKTDSLFDKAVRMNSFFYNRQAARELESIIETEKPNIVHIHLYLNSFSVSILPVLKKYNLPVIMTLHEYRQICPSYLLLDKNGNICERCKNGNYLNCVATRCSKGNFFESLFLTLEMYYRRLFYQTEKFVDKFICVSNFIQKKHSEFNKNIASKSVVIYNPVNFIPDTEIIRGNYLLFFGRLSREKGLNTLINAMKQIPDTKLVIAGKGDLLLEKLPENVELIGFKSGDELISIIRNAMYTIVPSEWYETFGLSCVESLSLGTPVIASAIGALPEIIEHGKNGFLFTPKDEHSLIETINSALNISDYSYVDMCKNGYTSIEQFSNNIYIRQLLDLYDRLILEKS